MTTLITRNEIVKSGKIIGAELTKMQQAFYDEDMLLSYKEDNEEHLYLEQFDFFENETIEYETHRKIISLDHSNIDTFTETLSNKLKELFKTIDAKEFIIVSHLKRDFFGTGTNKFEPLTEAYKLLESIVGQKSYKEAFVLDLEILPDFIEILFWTTRCDPAVPEYIFLFEKDEKFQIILCKYGNIHLTEFGNERLTADTLTSLGWTMIEEQEFDNFTNDRKIEGRNWNMS